MAFPNDLSNVVVFKIHPAIGIARLSVNDDFFVFGDKPAQYKSNGLMKRQAVQFRIFAYGDNHVGLGELTPDVMAALSITAVWSAKVGNRKVAQRASKNDLVIQAEASSDVNSGQLTGSLPGFDEGGSIPLGQITPIGLFIPPKTGVFRQKAGADLPGFPGDETVSDNSCDGMVTVRLEKDGRTLDVLPACIIVCAHDFSPDVDPNSTLAEYLRKTLQIPRNGAPSNVHNQSASALDEAALEPCTSRFAPGIEVSFGGVKVEDIQAIFSNNSEDPRIDPREMRVRYKSSPADRGAVPGQLTSGLCSPWQSDYLACVGFWADHLPETASLGENSSTEVKVFRKIASDTSLNADHLVTANDFLHVDQVAVVRLRNGKEVETERPGSPAGDIEDAIA
jgi:hypothetical protein